MRSRRKCYMATARLRMLDLYKKPVLTETTAKNLKEQGYLDFFMALTAYLRSLRKKEPISGFKAKSWQSLNKDDYWQYSYCDYKLPDLRFQGQTDKLELFGLKLLRGGSEQSGKARLKIGSHFLPEAAIKSGTLEIQVPKRLAVRMSEADLYFLNEKGESDGRDFRLALGTGVASKAQAAANRLRALGFYAGAIPTEDSVSALKGQSRLDLFMASSAWIRPKKNGSDKIEEADQIVSQNLDKNDYWDYDDKNYKLPDPSFAGPAAMYTQINLRLKNTIEKGIYKAITDYNLSSEVEIASSTNSISVNVPHRLASKITQAKIYKIEQKETACEYIDAEA